MTTNGPVTLSPPQFLLLGQTFYSFLSLSPPFLFPLDTVACIIINEGMPCLSLYHFISVQQPVLVQQDQFQLSLSLSYWSLL